MGTGDFEEPAARGQCCESQLSGALHHPAQQGMAQHSALSAFLELMVWLFQPCRDPGISYQHRSGLLARAFGKGSGVVMGEAGYPSTPQVLDDLTSRACCNTLLPDSGSWATATGGGEGEEDTGRDT